MIPLIQREIEVNQWMAPSQFVNIIAISEMTPGPIAINSATFVGYKAAGFFGGMVATIGVAVPSLIIISVAAKLFFKFQKHPVNTMIFYGVRPVIAGLIAAAALFLSQTALLNETPSGGFLNDLLIKPFEVINIGNVFIMILSLLALIKFKIHPIMTLVGSGVLGIILFYVI